MKVSFKEINKTPSSKTALRHSPMPYWDEVLSNVWREYHSAERSFVGANKSDPNYQSIFTEFRERRRIFDLRKETQEREMVFPETPGV